MLFAAVFDEFVGKHAWAIMLGGVALLFMIMWVSSHAQARYVENNPAGTLGPQSKRAELAAFCCGLCVGACCMFLYVNRSTVSPPQQKDPPKEEKKKEDEPKKEPDPVPKKEPAPASNKPEGKPSDYVKMTKDQVTRNDKAIKDGWFVCVVQERGVGGPRITKEFPRKIDPTKMLYLYFDPDPAVYATEPAFGTEKIRD